MSYALLWREFPRKSVVRVKQTGWASHTDLAMFIPILKSRIHSLPQCGRGPDRVHFIQFCQALRRKCFQVYEAALASMTPSAVSSAVQRVSAYEPRIPIAKQAISTDQSRGSARAILSRKGLCIPALNSYATGREVNSSESFAVSGPCTCGRNGPGQGQSQRQW